MSSACHCRSSRMTATARPRRRRSRAPKSNRCPSATVWILDNVPEARAIGDALAFGTIESWLIWKLTGGAHLTDASNASRTQLMALEGRDWDDELCALMEVPRAHLPEIVDMAGEVGRCDPALLGAAIPHCGLAGDQQSGRSD